jgi:hypothetical protein
VNNFSVTLLTSDLKQQQIVQKIVSLPNVLDALPTYALYLAKEDLQPFNTLKLTVPPSLGKNRVIAMVYSKQSTVQTVQVNPFQFLSGTVKYYTQTKLHQKQKLLCRQA